MPQADSVSSTSRRGFLGSAVLAVTGAPLVVAAADPIFDLVERHREAFKEFSGAHVLIDKVAAKRAGRTVTAEDRERYAAISDAETEACEALMNTIPTTLAGIAAAVTWLVEYDKGCVPETSGRFMEQLAQSPLLISA